MFEEQVVSAEDLLKGLKRKLKTLKQNSRRKVALELKQPEFKMLEKRT